MYSSIYTETSVLYVFEHLWTYGMDGGRIYNYSVVCGIGCSPFQGRDQILQHSTVYMVSHNVGNIYTVRYYKM